MKTQIYPYSVITEDAGVITLTSERPTGFHLHRLDGNVEAKATTANEDAQPLTLRLTGTGRMVISAVA